MTKNIAIGEIVATDFRAASVFKEAGIDFCCGGKKSLEEACREKGLDEAEILNKLAGLASEPADTVHNFREWDPAFLCDYIVNTHHKFVVRSLPELEFYTDKIASVHGDHHPELVEVEALFSAISRELKQHLKAEEEIFFPAIKEYLITGSEKSKSVIREQMIKLSAEHEFAGGTMDKINVITKGYNVPSDGCNSYQVTFRLLEQFEDDLHIHVHLENNVLFPKVKEVVNQ
jgi:regulator of cell morphogenesis and NO signaling